MDIEMTLFQACVIVLCGLIANAGARAAGLDVDGITVLGLLAGILIVFFTFPRRKQ